MPLKKTVTIREIAKLADVSTATVSLVLNGKKGVSDETRERILKLMQEHNYVNKKAAGAEPQTQVCLLKYVSHGLVAEINQVGLAAIVDQIMSTCSDRNISLLVHSVDAQNVQAVLSQLGSRKPRGSSSWGRNWSRPGSACCWIWICRLCRWTTPSRCW